MHINKAAKKTEVVFIMTHHRIFHGRMQAGLWRPATALCLRMNAQPPPQPLSAGMLTSTTFDLPGWRITEQRGLVRGIVVRSPTIAQGLMGGLKSIVGGRIGAYTEMCEQARGQASTKCFSTPGDWSNGVVGLRYDASEVAQGATEVLCYGTAVIAVRAS